MDPFYLREVDVASLILGRFPYELGAQFIPVIRMRYGRALGYSLGVLALHPFANPFVRAGIARLQKEATKRGGLMQLLGIDDHRDLLARMVGLRAGDHLERIRVRRLSACLAMIGLIGALLDARVGRSTVRKGPDAGDQLQQEQCSIAIPMPICHDYDYESDYAVPLFR